MGDDGHRVGQAAGEDGDDVLDPRGEPVLGPGRVGFLDADAEAVEPELLDQVLARAPVGVGADRTRADRAGQAVHVRAGVGDRERGRRAGAADADCQGEEDG